MKKYYFKMIPKEFLRKIIELYWESRYPRFHHPKIRRGYSRSISGFTEDLLNFF